MEPTHAPERPSGPTILVATDFSQTAEAALDWASSWPGSRAPGWS